jgi:type IV pilus assembly protein PilN
MIKINLSPYRAERKKELILQQLIIGVVPLILTIAVVGLFWMKIKSDISYVESEIIRIDQEIKKQKVTMKKIEEFKKKKETLTKKMDIIKTLQKGKSGPVHILDELAINLPARLWLTSIKQKGMNLVIEGKSLDNISISNYMINLGKSPYFKSVDLKQIKTAKAQAKKGVKLKNFSITCNITFMPEKEAKL